MNSRQRFSVLPSDSSAWLGVTCVRVLSALQALALVVALGGSVLQAGESDEVNADFFETKIRPVLVEHCYGCHAQGADTVRGGLSLDTRDGIRRGGDSGAAVTPFKPGESLLLEAIRYESFEMPPDKRLPEQVVSDLERWVAQGAPDPRDEPARRARADVDVESGRQFWAFQPPRATPVPSVSHTAWPRSDIDRFVLARLEASGLQPVADADRQTLMRRASYALVGLPPTPEEIDAFVSDPSTLPVAFEKVVDRLLASERFGERWGRHWLDVVRFAQSSGGGRTLMFPDAWRYRDYVVAAFNNDVPYDLFVKQQIAGDLLETNDWQETSRNLTATAFLVLGPNNYELQDKDVLEMDIVDEQLDTIGKALLGMTIGCARCHDHKFDPIPTRDYYALAGILKSTRSVIHSNVSEWNKTELPLPPEQELLVQEHEAKVDDLENQLKSLQLALKKAGGGPGNSKAIDPKTLPGIVVDDTQATKTGTWRSSQSVGGYVGESYLVAEDSASITFAPKLPVAGSYEVRITYTPSSNRSPKVPVRIHHDGGESVFDVNQTQAGSIGPSILSLGSFAFDPEKDPHVVISNAAAAEGAVIADSVLFVPATEDGTAPKTALAEMADQEDKKRRARLAAGVSRVQKQIKQLQSGGPQRPVAMAVADRDQVGDISLAIRGVVHNAGPVVPRGVLQVALTGELPPIPTTESGRMQLADWIASADNPLTARVMVNRIWGWLFDEGLVRTVDNFGSMGDRPSHPELLDHLALRFAEDDWSVKKMIRRIMMSRVYQLSSAAADSDADVGNRLLRRMNRHRLDAECIRDSLLLLAGKLDLTTGGSNIKPGAKSEYGYQFESTRRSVYVPVFRNRLPQIFAAFDFADPNIQVGVRSSSTTAPQALLLMNHPLVMEQSVAAAECLLTGGDRTTEECINRAYRQVLGRLPSDRESLLAREFVGGSRDVERWGQFYQVLFQSLDFRYVH